MQTRVAYSVSALNKEVRSLLEHTFPYVWIEGEISNLRAPSSGHLYFSLKDAYAQVKCALFRQHIPWQLPIKDGMHVLALANVSLYEERGDFQLIIEKIEDMGDGALRRAFELLKAKLTEAGIFDLSLKKTLPKWPSTIGVITSATGAAIRDILSVLKRRCSGIPVIIYPTQVQGNQAADQIVRALKLANQRQECDVLLLARGGGSLEDLWPFNEERVAWAIHESKIPIMTGVGHETDVTIADFVADHRAPTPSAAAELVSPNILEKTALLTQLEMRLVQTIENRFQQIHLLLNYLEKRLPHPLKRLQDQAQKLDSLTQRVQLAQQHLWQHKYAALATVWIQLQRYTPQHRLQTALNRCATLEKRFSIAMQHALNQSREQFNYFTQALNNINPLNTLHRGYAIIMCDGKILRDSNDIKVNDTVNVQLAKGRLVCKVTAAIPTAL